MKIFTEQELDKILNNHKLWLSSGGQKGEKADLSYANLSSVDLSAVDLSSSDLSCAYLSYANLSYANLHYAKLSYSNLSCSNLHYANLSYANLGHADLNYTDLSYANFSNANLDFSSFPLWCGGLNVNIDDKIAIQLLYHFVRNVKSSPYTSKELKSLCKLKSIIKQANKFHRVGVCGIIEED